MKKIDFSHYKLRKPAEGGREIENWRRYAIQVCKDFNIKKVRVIAADGSEKVVDFPAMIFKYCKKNLEYVKGKVENTKEKFGTGKLEECGHYLISLFRKEPPWKK